MLLEYCVRATCHLRSGLSKKIEMFFRETVTSKYNLLLIDSIYYFLSIWKWLLLKLLVPFVWRHWIRRHMSPWNAPSVISRLAASVARHSFCPPPSPSAWTPHVERRGPEDSWLKILLKHSWPRHCANIRSAFTWRKRWRFSPRPRS